MEPMGDLRILPLTAERFADVATLFEQGGDPKWCWYSSPTYHLYIIISTILYSLPLNNNSLNLLTLLS